MATILKDLELDEVSLVDVPANPLATVPLFKRYTGEDMTEKTDWEVLAKGFEKEKEDLKSKVDTLEEENEKLKKALEDKEAVEKAADTIEINGEKIAKALIPASVLKHLEETKAENDKLTLHKRAEELLPNFKGTLEQRAALVKSVGDNEELLNLLTSADKLFAELFDELGKKDNEGDMLSPSDKLDALAKKYATDNGVTFEKAFSTVVKTKEGLTIYKQLGK